MRRRALRGALTAKLADGAIRVIDRFGLEEIKTRDLLSILAALRADGRVLVVAPATDERLILSARNLPEVEGVGLPRIVARRVAVAERDHHVPQERQHARGNREAADRRQQVQLAP